LIFLDQAYNLSAQPRLEGALDCNALTACRNGLNEGFMPSAQIKQVQRIVMYIVSNQFKVYVALSENGGIKGF
jgi:hypothetical protein